MALPVTDPESRILGLIGKAEPRLRDALLNAVYAARTELSLNEIVKLLEAGLFDEAIDRAATVGAISLAEEYAAVYTATGQAGAKFLTDAIGVVVGFDQVNHRAVQYMQSERLRFIQDFTSEQRRATRDALTDGIRRGLNPKDQARNFRNSIGLTQRQQAAVINYRNLLSEGSSEALTRQLRDRRFDSTIRRSIATKDPLTTTQIKRMTDRYGERYLKYRAEVIGRTEALRAVHAGNDELYHQAVEQGHFGAHQVERTWNTSRDGRERQSHAQLNGLIRGAR